MKPDIRTRIQKILLKRAKNSFSYDWATDELVELVFKAVEESKKVCEHENLERYDGVDWCRDCGDRPDTAEGYRHSLGIFQTIKQYFQDRCPCGGYPEIHINGKYYCDSCGQKL